MKPKYFVIAACLTAMLPIQAQELSFSGSDKPVFDTVPAKSTGLDHLYVLHSAAGVSMTYTALDAASPVTWYTFGPQGGGYAEELTSGVTRDGGVSTLEQVVPNMGYILEEGTTRTYVWVVNYADYPLHLGSVTPEPAGDCGTATLDVEGSGRDIDYYTITGVRKVLDRDIQLSYYTLRWSDESVQWEQVDTIDSQESFKSTIVVPAPLCNTAFTLAGDRFLRYWGEGQSVESDTYTTRAVDCKTTAVQAPRDKNHNNERGVVEGQLGGSAPAAITFTAYPTDAVTHYEWQQADDPNFDQITLRLNDNVVEQTFDDAGTFYWRYIGTNSDGSCQATSETYTVSIGESELLIPNIFSPGSTEGINDVWKVSYRSIVDFHCVIFNAWGNKIIELNDPSEGWDGTYKGKLVDTGVYYYVLRATGSDGKKYKKSGDINILRYKRNKVASTPNP